MFHSKELGHKLNFNDEFQTATNFHELQVLMGGSCSIIIFSKSIYEEEEEKKKNYWGFYSIKAFYFLLQHQCLKSM